MKRSWLLLASIIPALCLISLPATAGSRGGGLGNGYVRTRIVSGSVTAVDTTKNTITLQAKVGVLNATVTIIVDSLSKIIRHSAAALSSLSPGDSLEVTGLPVSITAKTLNAGNVLQSSTTGSTTTGSTTTGSGTSTGTTTTTNAAKPVATASAFGTVQTVNAGNNQLTLTLSDGSQVFVLTTAGQTVSRTDQVTLSAVKVGDAGIATVTVDSTGALHLSAITLTEASASTTSGSGGSSSSSGSGSGGSSSSSD